MNAIDRVSARALRFGIYGAFSDVLISSGTGFVANSPRGPCLVTARHCLTGRHHISGDLLDPNLAIPTRICIEHRAPARTTHVNPVAHIREERLYGVDETPLWFEDEAYGDLCDYAVLPLTQLDEVALHPVNTVPGVIELGRPDEVHIDSVNGFVTDPKWQLGLSVADPVSVVGYPFGHAVNGVFPLWTTGTLASDPGLRDTFGMRFIDCRARPGQSGSPVYVKRRGSIPQADGRDALICGFMYAFLGLYSGRLNDQSELGIVWSAERIHTTLSRLDALPTAKTPRETAIGGPLSRLTREV